MTGFAVAPGAPVMFRGGLWTVQFTIDRAHSDSKEALKYVVTEGLVFADPTIFGRAARFDLMVTVDGTVFTFASCGLMTYAPAPHSDRDSLIRYGFTGATLTYS